VTEWPAVGIVVPTRNRPTLLRTALDALRAQDYPGRLEIVVVYDQAAPDLTLADPDADRPVRVIVNEDRAPGLAGARNTGVLALSTELVAFCDDDDAWLPEKLTRQVTRLLEEPESEMVTCAIEVHFGADVSARLAGTDRVRHADLLRSRMAMLHSSTFVLRRDALLDLGLVAEDAPGSQNEDYDLLLRASRRAPIAHVDEPLVRVRWGATSHFAAEYETKIASLEWMLARHPEFQRDPAGVARIFGQLACWNAAKGAYGEARRWARRALRARWREPRAVIALAASARVVKVERVVTALHRRGHGI
jgi:glycosyltransferase involved in cell wall biosynthesis